MTLALHVLPVGRSLLARAEDEPALKPVGAVLDPRSFDTTANPDRSVAVALRAMTTDRRIGLDRVLTQAQRATLRGAEVDVCAEWNSVARAAMRRSDTGRAVALIASDTNDGLRSAMLVAARYAADGVRYVDEPLEARHLVIAPGEVWVFRIPGLDLTAATTDRTWASLGSVGHVVQRTGCQAGAGRWTVTLHLTGGYKAMLPYLLVMAEGVKSVFRDADSVAPGRVPTLEAVSIHEHRRGVPLPDQTMVELPVRWLRGGALTALRALAEHTRTNPRVISDCWDDWAGQWLTDGAGGGARLSPDGMILTGVL